MAELPIEELRRRVLALVAGTPLRDQVADVSVSPSDFDPAETLHVRLKLGTRKKVDSEIALALIQSIQEAVTDVDDRFPSVYFDEAA